MSEHPKKSLFRRFFAGIWKLAVILYRTLFVISLLIGLVVIWSVLKGVPYVPVEDNVALVVAPTGLLVEQIDQDPGQRLFENMSGMEPSQTRLRDLVDALDFAAADPRIAFAVLKLDGLADAGLPQLQELVAAMQRFRAAGKKIVAYSPWYEQTTYYAAAHADEVVVDPLGLVHIEGFSNYNSYFKDALDKLGVQMHVFRVGEFKSAVEPFIRNDMSAEARASSLEWLEDLWSAYSQGVGAARKLAPNAVPQYVDRMAPALQALNGDAAVYAQKTGLVTHVETLKAFRERMGTVVGMDEDHGSFRQIYHGDYLRAVGQERRKPASKTGGAVGLVVVQGEIVDGPGEIGQAGGDTIAELLDGARRDPDIAAVVLRIDSPGGSVWASEQIRREVQALKAEGKPVVASMSSVAASGGYWIAMDANEIWAHPTTITGSIGIFGLVPTFQNSLAKLGVYSDGVGTTELAGSMRLDRPLTPAVSAIIQSQVDKGYRDFIEGVATARGLPLQKVHELARGRVWSGSDARELGLVDHFGGLEEAAAAAARLAQLDPEAYKLEELLPERGFSLRMLTEFSGRLQLQQLSWAAPWVRSWLARPDLERVLRSLNDPQGLYARCDCIPSMGGSTPAR